jgi:hypothetical protein
MTNLKVDDRRLLNGKGGQNPIEFLPLRHRVHRYIENAFAPHPSIYLLNEFL